MHTSKRAFLEMTVSGDPDDVILSVSGEVDYESSGTVDRCVQGVLSQLAPGPLTLDLGRITFMDAAGLRPVIAARCAAECARIDLRIVAASEPVLRLLDLCSATTVVATRIATTFRLASCTLAVERGVSSPRAVRITVAGELDATSLPALRTQLAFAHRDVDVVELDLGAVEFASVGSAKLLVGELAPRLALVRASRAVERAIRLVGAARPPDDRPPDRWTGTQNGDSHVAIRPAV